MMNIQLTIIKIEGYGPWTLTLGSDREAELQMLQADIYHDLQNLFSKYNCLVFFNTFDEYFVKIEEALAQFETMIRSRLLEHGNELFSSLIADMDPLSSARCFLAMLYLALKGRIHIEEITEKEDILLCLVLDGSP